MGMNGRMKTEHNGAKNGGGAWGRRVMAKAESKKLRRENAKDMIRDGLTEALDVADGRSEPQSITFWIEPFPPSTNHLFANVAGRGRIKSEAYRTWINAAGWDVAKARPGKISGHINLKLTFCESKRRSNSDLSNRIKAVEDLLVRHGVIDDDSLVDDLHVLWGEALGGVRIHVEKAGDARV